MRTTVVVAIALVALAAGTHAAAQTNEFIPFVTDFPQTGTDPGEEFIPFVTDFPGSSALRPYESDVRGIPQPDRFDWSNALLGAGTVLSLVIVLVAAAGAPRFRRRIPAPERSDRD